jgi:hypothetical protein
MSSESLKLKIAIEEIKEILIKHDMAGAIVVHRPGEAEHYVHLNASYSCAYMISDTELRFYSKRADYNTQEEQIEKLTSTANMLNMLQEGAGRNFMFLDPLTKMFDDVTNAQHYGG